MMMMISLLCDDDGDGIHDVMIIEGEINVYYYIHPIMGFRSDDIKCMIGS